MTKPKTKLVIAWVGGLGVMFGLYFAGNPFGIYDDIVIAIILLYYTTTSLNT